MKTLKKGSEFKRLADTSYSDRDVINKLLWDGWNYCPKSVWKENRPKKEEKPKKIKKEKK